MAPGRCQAGRLPAPSSSHIVPARPSAGLGEVATIFLRVSACQARIA